MRTADVVSTLLSGGATPIDLRSEADFTAGHLPDALNTEAIFVPADPFGSTGGAAFDASLLLYGAGGGAANEYVAAFVLEATGYSNIVYYLGGWEDWSANAD